MKTKTTSNVAAWLLEARQLLTSCSDQPALETQVLLAAVLEQPRSWILAHPEIPISPAQDEILAGLLAQRLLGAPLPYLLGHWEFYGLDFIVNESVLIPRPETEFLVEEALEWLRGRRQPMLAADVGTGSGCIAVALACHTPNLTVIASDLSGAALQVAQKNVLRHGQGDRVHLLQADLLKACAGPFNLLCANLPYIPSATLDGLSIAAHEPRLALDGGPDGLRQIERLLSQTAARLAPGGLVLFEIEAGQGESAAEAAYRCFPDSAIHVLPDLAGQPRLLKISLG
jgi:release factor glutamine methyltransferase